VSVTIVRTCWLCRRRGWWFTFELDRQYRYVCRLADGCRAREIRERAR
jgi:hypothetical protein